MTITTDKGLALALQDHFTSGAEVLHLYLFTAQSPSKPPAAAGGGGGGFLGGGDARNDGNAMARGALALTGETGADGADGAADGMPWGQMVAREHAGRTGGKGGLNAKAKQRQNAAAMLIQSVQRGHHARKEYRVMVEALEEAREEQQAADDAAERVRQETEDERVRLAAESSAQKQALLAAAAEDGEESGDGEDDDEEEDELELSPEDLAALDIQRVFRGHLRRKRLRFEQRRKELQGGAASLITRVARGHVARNLVVQLQLEQLRVKSATDIQRIARGNAARKRDKARRELEAARGAKALRIQNVVRGHWGRVYAKRLRFEGAGGVVLNRYKLEPLNLTRAQKEAKEKRDLAREQGTEGPGEAEYLPATCLKTNRRVLIRQVKDLHSLNKELALLNFIGPDHVVPLFEVHSDTKINKHALVFARPDKRLDTMLRKRSDLDSATKTEVIVGVAQALQAVHSKRVAICNLSASKVVKVGKVWKILGLELAHKDGEIFGNRLSVPGAPPKLSGIPWVADTACDSPESVAAWATKTEDALKASSKLDLWNLGALTYRVLAAKPLFKDRDAVSAALDPKNLLVGKEFECDLDGVYDVMGKYLLENLLCLNPDDRMPSKDVALYAAQIGSDADYYGQAASSDDDDANIAANDLRENGVEIEDEGEEEEEDAGAAVEGEGEGDGGGEEEEDDDEEEESNVAAYQKIKKREAAAAEKAGAKEGQQRGESGDEGHGESVEGAVVDHQQATAEGDVSQDAGTEDEAEGVQENGEAPGEVRERREGEVGVLGEEVGGAAEAPASEGDDKAEAEAEPREEVGEAEAAAEALREEGEAEAHAEESLPGAEEVQAKEESPEAAEGSDGAVEGAGGEGEAGGEVEGGNDGAAEDAGLSVEDDGAGGVGEESVVDTSGEELGRVENGGEVEEEE